MGTSTEIDVTAVIREGQAYAGSAEELGRAAERIRRHRASAAAFGRRYTDDGTRYVKALAEISIAVDRWRDGARAIADGLRGSARALHVADAEGARAVAGATAGADGGVSGGR